MRVLDEDLPSSGLPSRELRAIAVDDREQPDTVAEWAMRIVLVRRPDGRLAERKREHPGKRAAVNLWFIAWGSIIRARDGGLVLGSLAIAPRLSDSAGGTDVAAGITAELLRVLSPARIVSEAVAYIGRADRVLRLIEAAGGRPMPEAQRRAHARIRESRVRPARVPDDDIAMLAARYVALYRRGIRRPLAQLADEFGITVTQARDRIHRARHELGYLTPGTQGRAGAQPTPRLLALINPPGPPETATPVREERNDG
jgi:hypothetical protein